jgi:hypothetical protein
VASSTPASRATTVKAASFLSPRAIFTAAAAPAPAGPSAAEVAALEKKSSALQAELGDSARALEELRHEAAESARALRELKAAAAEKERALETLSGASGRLERRCRELEAALALKPALVWVDDEDAARCMNAKCAKPFGLLRRRHHCRLCGCVFCNSCTSERVCILPDGAAPAHSEAVKHATKSGATARACAACHAVASKSRSPSAASLGPVPF